MREQNKLQLAGMTAKMKQTEVKIGQLERQIELRVWSMAFQLCVRMPDLCDSGERQC